MTRRRTPRAIVKIGSLVALLGLASSLTAQDELEAEPFFDWDLVSLEQNNPRFNGSVLSGFHSIRSPGVTPFRGWKAGLGVLYTREQQISTATQARLFTRNQIIVNPKLNLGLLPSLEAGLGATGSWASGRELVELDDGSSTDRKRENLDLTSVDLGAKWKFFDAHRMRFALSFDSRIAVDRREFGNLPGSLFNFEIDGDFAVTSRFLVVGNLQLLTSDSVTVKSQVIGDIGAVYSFTDRFRGMLFGTVQEDDEAGTALGFVGVAGQFVVEQHSFTLAFDLQLNDANRSAGILTQEQVDVEFSYTFTF